MGTAAIDAAYEDTVSGAIGDCTTDSFAFTSPGNVGSPVICGFNSGQHSELYDATNGTSTHFITRCPFSDRRRQRRVQPGSLWHRRDRHRQQQAVGHQRSVKGLALLNTDKTNVCPQLIPVTQFTCGDQSAGRPDITQEKSSLDSHEEKICPTLVQTNIFSQEYFH